jgi:replication initiation protein RepC
MYVARDHPGWVDLHRAAARLRHDLGIRTGTEVNALDQRGADAASIAIMITAERESRVEIRLTPDPIFQNCDARSSWKTRSVQEPVGLRTTPALQ